MTTITLNVASFSPFPYPASSVPTSTIWSFSAKSYFQIWANYWSCMHCTWRNCVPAYIAQCGIYCPMRHLCGEYHSYYWQYRSQYVSCGNIGWLVGKESGPSIYHPNLVSKHFPPEYETWIWHVRRWILFSMCSRGCQRHHFATYCFDRLCRPCPIVEKWDQHRNPYKFERFQLFWLQSIPSPWNHRIAAGPCMAYSRVASLIHILTTYLYDA